jgi:hypothetical protein
VNGNQLNGTSLGDGQKVTAFLANESNYPVNLKFGRPKLSTNDKMFLGSASFISTF